MQRALLDTNIRWTGRAAAGVAALLPGAAFAAADNALLPRNLSPWGMFMGADIVVKAVMIGLAFASLVTWTVWLAKTIELRRQASLAKRRVRLLESDTTLAEVEHASDGASDAVAQIIQSAARETSLSRGIVDDGLKERIALRLERVEAAMSQRIARGTGVLATIGATAPFVGLFGTVWGIMNSFIGISEAHTTNLAVVAPGIAEALLATALGLVAAIPAVVIYNHLARSIAAYRALLTDASAQVLLLVSRQRDTRRLHAVAGGGVGHGRETRQARGRRRRSGGSARDQRHAVHRRDAGAAHHLHGGGAACHRRSRRRSAGQRHRAGAAAGQAGVRHREAGSVGRGRRGHHRARRARRRRSMPPPRDNKDERIYLRADKASATAT